MNKDFQETASLSIVLTLFIHEIRSKHDRDHNIQAEYLTDVTKTGSGERKSGNELSAETSIKIENGR